MENDEETSSGQMMDEIYANGDDKQPHKPIISSGEQLDVEAYASLYSGRTKIMRLLFIADRCDSNPSMQLEALRMAYDEIKKGEDTQLFKEAAQRIDNRLGPNYGYDSSWIEAVERRAEQRKEKLDNELNAYRTNLIKESIRMGYNDFGDFYYAHGQFGDAFKSYVRTRDYCTTAKHIITMCLNAILVSIEMGQFSHVTSYISKAEQTPEALDPVTIAKLRCAAGLAHLEAKKYKLAARKFLEVGPELGNNYSEVIAPQDVATYGGLCALATFDRTELKACMSFAPKDTHEAQVQFALERGVPALIGIMATTRLPYPSRSFDMAHCSRCLIPWGQYDGLYLIEVDRILRPGGYWILSGPPINWEGHWQGWERSKEDLSSEQNTIEAVAKSLCWKKLKQRGDIAVWQKPYNHEHCKKSRKVFKKPRFCKAQDPDLAWYTKMEDCLTPLPPVSNITEIAGGERAKWPARLTAIPPRVSSGSLEGIIPDVFTKDTVIWKERLAYYKSLNNALNDPGRYRNLLDMNANLGGFAAALVNDPVWVMNVVPVEARVNTLGVVFERGLIGTYQSWCEAMSTYPRTYDLLHADSVFSLYDGRCKMEDILLEMDRILRPEGCVIFRDDIDVLVKVKTNIDEMQWDSIIYDHEEGPMQREKVMVAVKQYWTAPAPAQTDS
uniref:Methyltransferase n=1 Tax=Chenopodium quinoa TaxID=63459 RepID=A0A803M3F0_CHEQI